MWWRYAARGWGRVRGPPPPPRTANESLCTLLHGAQARDEVLRVLQQLKPELREVFVLYHHEGLTLQEISDILGRPISTIGDRLKRARTSVRELVSVS